MMGYEIQIDLRWYGSQEDWDDFLALLQSLEKEKYLGVYGIRFESNFDYQKYG